MFGLSVDTLRKLREVFVGFSRIQKVVIYGSRAKGNYKTGSDIDITLIGKNLTLGNAIYPLQDALDQLDLLYTFDISIFNQLDEPEFIDHILRVGKTFYQKDEAVMDGWEKTTLGAVCEVIAGQSPKGSNYNDSGDGLPFYQGKKEFGGKHISAPTKWTTQVTREAIAGDVLMSVRAPVGPINFATERICIGRGLASIRAKEKIHRDFLFYLLLSMQEEIKGNEGAVFASINKKQIANIQFSKPPLPEQKRIVAILDETFTAIATATANTKKNLANAQELFQGQLNRVFRNPESTEDSGEGGPHKSLAEACLIRPPKREVKSKLNADDEVSFVPMEVLGVRQKSFDSTQTRPLRKVYGDYTYFADNDVLLAKITPCFQNGKLGIARDLKNGIGFGSSEFFVFRCLRQLIPEYLFYFLSQHGFTDAGVAQMSGAVGHQRVPLEFIQNYQIPLPPLPQQKRIVAMLDNLSAETQSLVGIYKTKASALTELKQSLLHQAFTGELTTDPNAADRILSEAGV